MMRPAGLVLSVFALLLVLATVTTAAEPAVVRPDPLQTNVRVGQTFAVNLYVQDVTDLYAADIHLLFDPTILQVEDARPEVPGIQIQPLATFISPDFIIKQKACNAPSVVDPDCQTGGFVWYAVAQLNPAPPAYGSGPVAAITFRAIRAGSSPLTISYHKLSSPKGVDIPSTSQGGVVQVADPTRHYEVNLPSVFR